MCFSRRIDRGSPCTHRLALPGTVRYGGGHLMVNTAKRELRWHVDADWIHARGMAKEHPDDQRSRHRRSRPQNPRQFEERWTAECCVRKGRLYYKPQRMPRGYDGGGASGVGGLWDLRGDDRPTSQEEGCAGHIHRQTGDRLSWTTQAHCN